MKTKLNVVEISRLMGEVSGYVNTQTGDLLQAGLIHLTNLTGQQALHFQRLITECQRIMKDVDESKKALLTSFPSELTDQEKDEEFLLVVKTKKSDSNKEPKDSVITKYAGEDYFVSGKDYYKKVEDSFVYCGELEINKFLVDYTERIKSIYSSEFEIEHFMWKESILNSIVFNEVSDKPNVKSVPTPTVFFKLLTIED